MMSSSSLPPRLRMMCRPGGLCGLDDMKMLGFLYSQFVCLSTLDEPPGNRRSSQYSSKRVLVIVFISLAKQLQVIKPFNTSCRRRCSLDYQYELYLLEVKSFSGEPPGDVELPLTEELQDTTLFSASMENWRKVRFTITCWAVTE